MVQIQHRSLLKNVSTLEVRGQCRSAPWQHLQRVTRNCSGPEVTEQVQGKMSSTQQFQAETWIALGKDLWKKRTINISFSHGKLYSSMQLCIWETISLSRSFPFILTFCILPVRCLLCSFLRGLRMLYCGIQPDRRAAAFSSCSSFLK